MKKNTAFKNIPVIAVTASLLDNEYKKLIDFGFDDVISKPYTKDMLEAAISKYIVFTKDAENTDKGKGEEESLSLTGEIQKLYKETFGERIKANAKRNNFSETSELVNDFREFLKKNPNKELEALVNVLSDASMEFDVIRVDMIFKILIKNLNE